MRPSGRRLATMKVWSSSGTAIPTATGVSVGDAGDGALGAGDTGATGAGATATGGATCGVAAGREPVNHTAPAATVGTRTADSTITRPNDARRAAGIGAAFRFVRDIVSSRSFLLNEIAPASRLPTAPSGRLLMPLNRFPNRSGRGVAQQFPLQLDLARNGPKTVAFAHEKVWGRLPQTVKRRPFICAEEEISPALTAWPRQTSTSTHWISCSA
jgi:hypothetical protein